MLWSCRPPHWCFIFPAKLVPCAAGAGGARARAWPPGRCARAISYYTLPCPCFPPFPDLSLFLAAFSAFVALMEWRRSSARGPAARPREPAVAPCPASDRPGRPHSAPHAPRGCAPAGLASHWRPVFCCLRSFCYQQEEERKEEGRRRRRRRRRRKEGGEEEGEAEATEAEAADKGEGGEGGFTLSLSLPSSSSSSSSSFFFLFLFVSPTQLCYFSYFFHLIFRSFHLYFL